MAEGDRRYINGRWYVERGGYLAEAGDNLGAGTPAPTPHLPGGGQGLGPLTPNPMDNPMRTNPDGTATHRKAWAHEGPTQGFSFGNLDNAQDEFYNRLDNRGVAWQKLTDWANPNGSNSNYGGWLQSQMNDEYNRYAMADAEDGVAKQTKWIEYLEKLAPGLRNQFNSMSARQRGENPALYDSGVYLG